MKDETSTLMPYYRNGLLYFPTKTVEMLHKNGLSKTIAQAASAGLSLDDEAEMQEVRSAVQAVLNQSAKDSAIYAALNNPETQFMLTGKPAYNA